MPLPKSYLALATLLSVSLLAPFAAPARGAPSSGVISLVVGPHRGGEAIDVSGRAPAGQSLTITLVATFSLDMPDVVLSRTVVATDAGGAFDAVVSLAPGFMRGSVTTVYAVAGSGPAAEATYLPDAPNRGVMVPLDQIPRSVR